MKEIELYKERVFEDIKLLMKEEISIGSKTSKILNNELKNILEFQYQCIIK